MALRKAVTDWIFIYLVFCQLLYPIGRSYGYASMGERVFFIKIYSQDISEDEGQQIFKLMEEEIIRKGDFILVSGKKEEEKEEAFSKGRSFFEKGKMLYEGLELTEAVDEFKKAIPFLERSFELKESSELLKHLFMYLSMSHIALGKREEGTNYIRRVILIDRNFNPDPLIYPPFIREEMARQREVLEIPSSSTLIVETVPVAADVRINGKYYGKTPLIIRDLSAGRYEVTLMLRGYSQVSEYVYLAGGETIRVIKEMTEDEISGMIVRIKNAITKGDMNTTLSSMERISLLLNIEKILLAVLGKKEENFRVDILVIDSSKKKILKEANVSFLMEERVKYIKELVDSLSRKEVYEPAGVEEEKPFYKSVWFIVLIGIIVIAAGAMALSGGGGGGGGSSSSTSTGSVTVNF